MRRIVLFTLTLIMAGCNANDAATLGRIGSKLHQRVDQALFQEPNAKLIKTLPLLQPPDGGRNRPPLESDDK